MSACLYYRLANGQTVKTSLKSANIQRSLIDIPRLVRMRNVFVVTFATAHGTFGLQFYSVSKIAIHVPSNQRSNLARGHEDYQSIEIV